MKDTEDGNDNEDTKDDGEENQKTESISESLSEIFVNSEKTLDQIEDLKKQVRFNLEPEDMDMATIESNFATDIPVGDIVNKLFKVQDSDKKEEEKIDDDYVNFPLSQANADSFFDEMRQKEENKYMVETEDITDDESEDKSTDLKPVKENNTTENNDVEDSKESEKVKDEKIEALEENDTKENKEEMSEKTDNKEEEGNNNKEEEEGNHNKEDEEENVSLGYVDDGIHKKEVIEEVEKKEAKSEDEGSEDNNSGEDGLIYVER